VEKRAGRSVAKGKRVFKNRIIIEKGRENPLLRLELPNDFLELTLKWKYFETKARRVVPFIFVKSILYTLLLSSKEREERNGKTLIFKGEIKGEFFAGIEKLVLSMPTSFKRIQFRKLLKGVIV